MVFILKRITERIQLKLYNQELERVGNIKFLGIWFDKKLKWDIHIQKPIDKCKIILNMKCLVGKDWGAEEEH